MTDSQFFETILIMKTTSKQIQNEALHRAKSRTSLANYPIIIQGFLAKGISIDDIKPRENVFTFNAWKALGRVVRKGEHGIKVCTFREDERFIRDSSSGETRIVKEKKPWFSTVFHISQTEPLNS